MKIDFMNFSDEMGFVNAQIIDTGDGNFRITIVKQIKNGNNSSEVY